MIEWLEWPCRLVEEMSRLAAPWGHPLVLPLLVFHCQRQKMNYAFLSALLLGPKRGVSKMEEITSPLRLLCSIKCSRKEHVCVSAGFPPPLSHCVCREPSKRPWPERPEEQPQGIQQILPLLKNLTSSSPYLAFFLLRSPHTNSNFYSGLAASY